MCGLCFESGLVYGEHNEICKNWMNGMYRFQYGLVGHGNKDYDLLWIAKQALIHRMRL